MFEKYKTLYKVSKIQTIEKKSKFITTSTPVNSEGEAQAFINHIRKKYSDASHNVYAYRVFEKNQIERQSDDGEPSGTAGLPILEILRKDNIQNAVTVVTRYYGGTLLGASGLMRTYGNCAKNSIILSGVIEKVLYQAISIKVDYNLYQKVHYEILKNDYIIKDTIYLDNIEFKILVETSCINNFIKLITNICKGENNLILQGKVYGYWYNGNFYT